VQYERTVIDSRRLQMFDVQDHTLLLLRDDLFGKGRCQRVTEHAFNQGFLSRVLGVDGTNQMTVAQRRDDVREASTSERKCEMRMTDLPSRPGFG